MKKYTRPVSILIAIIYLVLIPINAFSASLDVSAVNASDMTLLNKWKSMGIIESSVSAGELSKPVQKIDFIMFINKILNSSRQAEISFSDVQKDSWYAKEIAKAVASGFIQNETGKSVEPFKSLSRVEAAVMVTRVFGLELKDDKLINKIGDSEKLSPEELRAFAAVIEKGYLSEISSGRYAPLGVIKLIDAIKMLDKCIGQVIVKEGTYTQDVSGNLLIAQSLVNLKDMEVSGDLIIGEGVAEGAVKLDNVSIRGKLIVRGGGANGITIKNSRVANEMVVQKPNGNVNIVAEGSTTINNTSILSGAMLVEQNLTSGKGFVNINLGKAAEVNQTATIQGSFGKINLNECNLNVNVNGNSDSIVVSKDSTACLNILSGTEKILSTQASKSTIQLQGGTVSELNIEAGAKGNVLAIDGNVIVGKLNVNDTSAITINKGTVETLTLYPSSAGSTLISKKEGYIKNFIANGASTITGLGKIDTAYIYANDVNLDIKPSSFYIAAGVSAVINGTIIDPTRSTVSFSIANNNSSNKIIIQEGNTETLQVSGLTPPNSTLAYISSNNSIVTVNEKGVVKGLSTGTTKVHVTGQYPGYNTKIVDLDVIVTSGNVTIPGTLTISPAAGEAGKNAEIILLTYTAADNLSNGTIVFKLPAGFAAYEADTVKVGSGEEKALDASQRPNTQTISLSNIDLQQGGTIIIKLKNKVIPSGGDYTFSAITDADGYGPKIPTTGDSEKTVFTADSLRRLVQDVNYSTPEYGSIGGTVKISKLSTLGFFGSTKWAILVQDAKPSEPAYDSSLTGMGYTVYKQGDNIQVLPGQNLRLVAIDDNDKVKGFADITIDASWIRPYDAANLEYGINYFAASGIQAGTLRLTGLNYPDAHHWMIKVQDTASELVFRDSVLTGAGVRNYNEGDDIAATVNQNVLLVAVDKDNKIKAFANVFASNNLVSKEANVLQAGNNYSLPQIGTELGTTSIRYLNPSNQIDKWMVVDLSKDAVKPGLNASLYEYTLKYSEGKSFVEYKQGENISVTANRHILLVGVKTDIETKKDLIQAYADLIIGSGQIRGENAPEMLDTDGIYGPLEMGSKEFTTRFASLNLNGSEKLVGAEKFMVKVQNEAIEAPQMNSIAPVGFVDYAADGTSKADIKPTSSTQKIVLIATDKNGRIKAYANIPVNASRIRPGNAPTFTGYKFIPGSTINSTTIVSLPAGGPNNVTGFDRWEYKIQNTAFDIPYTGCIVEGTQIYPPEGTELKNVTVNQHVLILAVNEAGQVLAYADEILNLEEIKQPLAAVLKPKSAATPIGYHYSIPEPGQVGGYTMIQELNNWDIAGAQKWYYMLSDTELSFGYDSSIPNGFYEYTAKKNVTGYENKYFVLLAADNYGHVKAFANIKLTAENLSLPALKTPDNYTMTVGSTAGTTSLKDLKFTNLPGATRWMYATGAAAFSVPSQGTNISTLSYKNDLNELAAAATQAEIAVSPNQYIVLLAVSTDGTIKGYANIKVDAALIKPADAPLVTGYALEKGYSEGTTRFSSLNLTAISGATQWMIYVQPNGLTEKIGIDTAPPASAKKYDYSVNPKPDIAVTVNDHIILLAVDSSIPRKIKAYADIQVSSELIQTPFAKVLETPVDYSGPRPGTNDGTVNFTLLTNNIPDKDKGTIVWKYKTGTAQFTKLHYDEDASGLFNRDSNGDFVVQPDNWILVAATIDNKVKAYFQVQVGVGSIKPIKAPFLKEGITENFTHPIAGNTPGTTRFERLDPIGLPSTFAGWVVKDSETDLILMLGSKLDNAVTYSQGADISTRMGHYVVLAAVDRTGSVLAYTSVLIDSDSELKPPLETGFDNNYSGPEMGSVKGTTRFMINLSNLNGAVSCAAKVSDSSTTLTAGTEITLGGGTGTNYNDYRQYNSLADIAVKANQFVLLVALDNDKKVIAYANIKVPETAINPGYAFGLTKYDVTLGGGNYSELTSGTTAGTVKFTYLNKVGAPELQNIQEKWIVQVVNTPVSAPLLNTKLSVTAPNTIDGYTPGANIDITQGKYVVLYVVDPAANSVKGFACIQVRAEELAMNSTPVAGTSYYTTKVDTSGIVLPSGTTLQYIVQNSSQGIVLKDGKIAGLKEYAGGNISAVDGQYLLFAAVDAQGAIKAFKEIKLTTAMVKLPNTSVALSGTLISAPVSEADIEAGGKTLVITLNDGQWADDIATNATLRNALYTELKLSGTTDAAQWSNVITALKNAAQASAPGAAGITRTSDNVVTITFPRVAGFQISKTMTVTLTIPAACILGGKAVAAAQTITIENLAGATLSGTFTENEIVAGSSKTIKIELKDGVNWANDVATNPTIKNALLNGFKPDSDAGNQWAELVPNAKVVRSSATVVNITFPASSYDISVVQTISLTIPASAVIGSSFNIPADGTVTITPVTVIVPAVIMSVTAPTGKYKFGDTVSISVKYDKKVTVTSASSSTTIALITLSGKTTTKNAVYSSGSGTDTLVFTYKVQTGDDNVQLEYKSGSSINGTVVNMGTTTAANKLLPEVGSGVSLGSSNVAIDGIIPLFATGYPKAGSRIAADESDALVKLNDIATIYYVAVNYSPDNTAPSAEQIKSGSAGGLTVVKAGTYEVEAANSEFALTLTSLTDNRGYTVYMYAEDLCGNKSPVTAVTVDNKPPVFTVPESGITPSDNSISITVNTNEIGNIYAVALTRGAMQPLNTEVRSNTKKITQIVGAANVGKDIVIKVTGLTVSTDYDIYIVCEDASAAKNLSLPYKLEAKTSQLDLSKVDVDLANNILLNTTNQMQYSLDGYTWTPCLGGTTKVNFVYDDVMPDLKLLIREALNPDNRITITLSRGNNSVIVRSLIDYDIAAGTIVNYSTISMDYRVSGGTWKPLPAKTTTKGVVFAPGDLELRTAATSPTSAGKDSKLPSFGKTVDSIPERPEAPEVTADDTSNSITGLLAIHEYSINDGKDWISGDIPGNFAGTKKILVRFKASSIQLASQTTELNFTANVITVTAAPASGTTKATVKLVFEENTNKAGQSLTAQQVADWFEIGTEGGELHQWGTDITGKFNTTGKELLITFNSMTGSTIKIGDVVIVTAAAGIKNSANTSEVYSSSGTLGGSFNTVPVITSIKAVNANGDSSFSNGDKLVLTFDQPVKEKYTLTAANIANYLILTDGTGKVSKKWSLSGTPKLTISWSADHRVLTITFNDTSDTNLVVGDKIWVSKNWGLTDTEVTTAACSSSKIISGSFTAP